MPKQMLKNNTWLEHWARQDAGNLNVGIHYVINPVLLRSIVDCLGTATRQPVTIYDIGCGTGSLFIDLINFQRSIDEEMRLIYRGFEKEQDLVNQGNTINETLGNNGQIQEFDANTEQIPFSKDDHTRMVVSRNFLMHIDDQVLGQHLDQVADALSHREFYVLAILNPEYEQKKHGGKLGEGAWYSYQHGTSGALGEFRQWFRSCTTYESTFSKRFEIVRRDVCAPETDEHKTTHPRYYEQEIPMAFVYVLRKLL